MVVLEPDSNTADDLTEFQRQIQKLLFDHAVNTSRSWGASNKWILELHDGRRVVVPIEIGTQRADFSRVLASDKEF